MNPRSLTSVSFVLLQGRVTHASIQHENDEQFVITFMSHKTKYFR